MISPLARTTSALPLAIALVATVASPAFALTLVSFANPEVAANVNHSRAATFVDGAAYRVAFSSAEPLTTELFPAGLAPYYGGYERVFAGGVAAATSAASRLTAPVSPNPARIEFNVNYTTAPAVASNVAAVVYWPKTSFAGEAASTTVGASGFELTGSGTNWIVGSTIRWVVGVGSQLYVSQATATPAAVNFSVSLPSVDGMLWAPYAPSSDLNFAEDVATFGALDVSDISAVGVYVEKALGGFDNQSAFRIHAFTATGLAIPEPATVLVLAIGLGLALAFLRRSRR